MVQPLWKTGWWLLKKKKMKIELPSGPAIPLLGLYPKELEVGFWRNLCISTFIVTFFMRAKRWKQPKCPSVDEGINKTWHVCTVEYYSALKRKEIQTHATTWMNQHYAEWNEAQQNKYCMITLTWGTWKAKCFLLRAWERDEWGISVYWVQSSS